MRRLMWAGIVLGLSLGGFFDGIVLHQVLQWHHMLSSVDDPRIGTDLSLNITADGFFHVATWILAIIGVILLWRARVDAVGSGRVLFGAILMGAGLFNLVEGVVDHHLLGVHHVRTDSQFPVLWDLGFLGLGLVLLVLGWAFVRSAHRGRLEHVASAPGRGRDRGHRP